MIRLTLLCGGLALLAACGVDGSPVPPAAPQTQAAKPGPKITISGELNMGVVVE